MRTNNAFGVQFITRTNKTNNAQLHLYARISVDSKRIEISLKRSIPPHNWNEAKGMAKGKSEDVLTLNTFLEQVRSRLTECYEELMLKKKLITAEAVKNLFCRLHKLIVMEFCFEHDKTALKINWSSDNGS